MRFTIDLLFLIALLGPAVYSAAILARQGAGVGAGCDSIASDTDTMIGESSRGTGKTVAGMLPRQGAGVGAGCNSIASDTDTMIGESSRGAGKTVAGDIPKKRQLNGIADGVTAVTGKAPGGEDFSNNADSFLNTVDGQGTDDSAEFGKDVGDEELNIGDTVGGSNGQNGGSAPPPGGPPPPPRPRRRQLNGIADGVTAVTGKAPGAEGFSDDMDGFLNTVDGNGTDDSAEAGSIVGGEELDVGKTVGGQNGQSNPT